VDILVLQVLNSLLYASVLFLLAAGLSLIFGVMGIVNLAHGSFYAVGAYVTAWAVTAAAATIHPLALFILLPLGAIAVALLGAVIEPLLIRPLYQRPEEYQLLITFGLLLVLEDGMRYVWGGTPLSASPVMDAVGILRFGELY
jgi:branched-subunit amino acid ABC-type transport system permease component